MSKAKLSKHTHNNHQQQSIIKIYNQNKHQNSQTHISKTTKFQEQSSTTINNHHNYQNIVIKDNQKLKQK